MKYLNENSLKRLININKDIIFIQKSRARFIYKIYTKTKFIRKISKRIQYKIFEKFDKIYLNLNKFFNVSLINGIKYYIFFTDQIILRT